ncbi:helix-turn-helix transcriptional regulator [Apibacter sp. HY039]|nr:helix-turn-helix transcriptional regulator [Apibacter sp. HY039]
MKSISQNIMLLRKKSNLSQTELAKKVGCSREIIS